MCVTNKIILEKNLIKKKNTINMSEFTQKAKLIEILNCHKKKLRKNL